MPNRQYIRGATFERDVASKLRKKGYLVVRSAGSHSPIDIVGIPTRFRKRKLLFIQCKAGSNNLKLKPVLNGLDVFTLTNLSLDKSLRRKVRYIVMIKRGRNILQFERTEEGWASVTII